MIRFPQIWEQYQKGELKERAPITANNQEKRESSQIVDEISSFEDKPVINAVDESQNQPENLESVVQTVGNVEQSLRKQLSFQSENIIINGHAIRAIRAGDYLDNKLSEYYTKDYNALQKKHKQLSKAKGAGEAKQQRVKTDAIYSRLQTLGNLLEKRNFGYTPGGLVIDKYAKEKNIIKSVDKEILLLKERLQTALTSDKPQEVLESIVKETKEGWLKSGIVKKCKQANYLEGLYELKLLRDEASQIAKYPQAYENKRDRIKEDINKVKKQLALAKEQGELHVEDMVALEETTTTFPENKYHKQPYLSLEPLVDEYQSMRNKAQTAAKERLKNYKRPVEQITHQYRPSATTPYFNFSKELKKIDLSLDKRLHVIDDVLQGRTGSVGWVATMEELAATTKELQELDVKKTSYPLEVYQTLKTFYEVGRLGELAEQDSRDKQTIEYSMQQFYEFAKKVALD